MEQREFLKIIRAYRRRMHIADFLIKSVFALSIGAGVGILFQAVAFFVPLYYADLYMILALLLAEVPVFVVMLVRRTTMEQAALEMDGFGFEERIVTAYENLDREGTLIGLQREDALRQLREHKDRIRIPLFPSLRRNALLLFLVALSVGLSLLPSAAKDRAGELHGIREEAQEKEEEIEGIIEALEQLGQEELTKEQQEMLREMAESLESSLSEYQQAVSETMLAAASQKLNYKYENIGSQLSDLIQELQNGAGVSVVSADSMMEMAERLEKSEMSLARGEGSGTGQRDGGGSSQSGQGSDGDGNGQSGQGGDRGESIAVQRACLHADAVKFQPAVLSGNSGRQPRHRLRGGQGEDSFLARYRRRHLVLVHPLAVVGGDRRLKGAMLHSQVLPTDGQGQFLRPAPPGLPAAGEEEGCH